MRLTDGVDMSEFTVYWVALKKGIHLCHLVSGPFVDHDIALADMAIRECSVSCRHVIVEQIIEVKECE